jgi:hypothetical protein
VDVPALDGQGQGLDQPAGGVDEQAHAVVGRLPHRGGDDDAVELGGAGGHLDPRPMRELPTGVGGGDLHVDELGPWTRVLLPVLTPTALAGRRRCSGR